MSKWKQIGSFCVTADKISLYFPSIKIFRVFCQKEEDLVPLIHKMLESLYLCFHFDVYQVSYIFQFRKNMK